MVSFVFKNHYERLGIAPDATEDEIRRAYRRMARMHHPDVAKDKHLAQDAFILINEAHKILSDPTTRQRYDNELSRRQNFTQSVETEPRMRNHAADDRAGVKSAVWEFAQKNPGSNRADSFQWKKTSSARPRMRKRPDLDARANIEIPLEDAINGALHTVTIECNDPGEQSHRLATYHVRIPAGVWQGQQLRLSSCGLQDAMTRESGDLYLKIHYARHKRFRLMGNNLFTEIEAPAWDAALGAFMRVPVLDGEAALQIPVGSQAGQRFTLKGHGMPLRDGERGDMVVSLKVTYPAAKTARQKDLWKALAREYKSTRG
jgi:curved DNA-binding protein